MRISRLTFPAGSYRVIFRCIGHSRGTLHYQRLGHLECPLYLCMKKASDVQWFLLQDEIIGRDHLGKRVSEIHSHIIQTPP